MTMDKMFDDRYAGNRLQNWEIPKYYPQRPRLRRGSTKVIADDRGHLLPDVSRPKSSPFSKFRSTYQLPDKLTRQFAKEYDDCLQQRHRYNSFARAEAATANCGKKLKDCAVIEEFKKPKCPKTCETVKRILSADKTKNLLVHPCEKRKPKAQKSADLEYVPGDFTAPAHQHESRQFLLDQKLKEDSNEQPNFKLNSTLDFEIDPEKRFNTLKAGTNDHSNCLLKSTHDFENDPLKRLQSFKQNSRHQENYLSSSLDLETDAVKRFNNFDESSKTPFTAPLPLTASLTKPLVSPPLEYFPHDTTSKETLDFDMKEPKMIHQSSITGKPHERCPSPVVPAYANFELAKRMHQENLDHQPLPDCVADLAYRKLQISGGPAGLGLDIDPIATGVGIKTYNAGPTHCTKLKVFRPKTCGVVPRPPNGDANFGLMNSSAQGKEMGAMDLAICWDYKPPNPADEPQPSKHIDGSNGSMGPAVFTYVKSPRDEGPPNTGRSAGVFQSTLGEADFFDKDIMRRKTDFTGRNIEQDSFCGGCTGPPMTRARSVTRDLGGASKMPSRFGKQYQSTPNVLSDTDYKALRTKYLGNEVSTKVPGGPACRRGNMGFFQRARTRLCHKVAPEPSCCHAPERRPPCKAAFRVGIPKYDASGFFVSSDSGCSMGSHCNGNRVLVVPRPRNPYMKKNYDIDTLVPPFTSKHGGAAQGGYPEHWRLASVYQHSFKPPEQRRRPLLDTVYK